MFEALEAAGRVTAAVNMVCYRGPVRHAPHVPWLTRPAYGPSRFFYFNLFESDVTGSPLAVRTRARGSVDEYARVVGRWLVTRDGFDFLVFYLPDYDYASHARGPRGGARRARARGPGDRDAVRGGGRARGVPRALRGAPLLGPRADAGRRAQCVSRTPSRACPFHRGNGRAAEIAVTASNRAGMVYRLPGCRDDLAGARRAARRREHTSSCSARTGPSWRGRTATSSASRRRRRLADERRLEVLVAARSAPAGLGRARQPERRRPRRLRRPRGRVRGSRWTPSRRRRKPRLAGEGRLRGPDALDRRRRASGEDRRRDAARARPFRRLP